jgi:GTP-binding protein
MSKKIKVPSYVSRESKNIQSRYRILRSDFVYSADSISALPMFDPPCKEVAFIGRSNVGKSSLVNAVLQRKKLARVGKTPGATKVFCFYEIFFRANTPQKNDENEANGLDETLPLSDKIIDYRGVIVDLPGYGFAKVSETKRKEWLKLITHYLSRRDSLQAVVLLIDCRRNISEEEREIIDLGQEGGLILCLTKSDKLSRNELSKKKSQIIRSSGLPPQSVIAVSTVGKDAFQRQAALRDCVFSYLL